MEDGENGAEVFADEEKPKSEPTPPTLEEIFKRAK